MLGSIWTEVSKLDPMAAVLVAIVAAIAYVVGRAVRWIAFLLSEEGGADAYRSALKDTPGFLRKVTEVFFSVAFVIAGFVLVISKNSRFWDGLALLAAGVALHFVFEIFHRLEQR